MKKFLLLLSTGIAMSFVSCASTKSDCCGSCKDGECKKESSCCGSCKK